MVDVSRKNRQNKSTMAPYKLLLQNKHVGNFMTGAVPKKWYGLGPIIALDYY